MLGLVLLVVIATPLFVDRVGLEEPGWIIPSGSVLGIGGIGGLIILMFLDRLPPSFSHWWAVRGLAILATDTRRVFLSPIVAFQAIGWSLAWHINISLVVYI